MGKLNACATDVQHQFQALARKWHQETGHFSSVGRMTRHPAYQEIIGLGWAAVPLLLAELRRQPDFWFTALREITREDPVPPASAGKMQEMTRAWLEWGKAKGDA